MNDVQGSKDFARYVVGRFARLPNNGAMLEPFEVAQSFVDSDRPRKLSEFLDEVDAAVTTKPPLH